MIRREETLLASFFSSSTSSSSASSVPSLIEYLQFQFSRLIALLPFLNTDDDDDVDEISIDKERREFLDFHATKELNCTASSGCNHHLFCRIISPLVLPIVGLMNGGGGGEERKPNESTHVEVKKKGKGGKKGSGRLVNRSYMHNLRSKSSTGEGNDSRKLDRSRLDQNEISPREVDLEDPFGLSSSCGGMFLPLNLGFCHLKVSQRISTM